jgi:NAD(P)-dependent dehydrogenase (short-subunit alcohol dehydrogenase family)
VNDPYSLRGVKALVTGGRRNIGRSIALALAQAGCDLGINDIERDEDAEETLRQVCVLGADGEFFPADVSATGQVEDMVRSFVARFGRIDILVNNAYAAGRRQFADIEEQEWDHALDVSPKGAFLCARTAARHMLAQGGGGNIVNIASTHAERAWRGATCYSVAKAGLQRLTGSIAVDLGEHGIRCNTLLPGYMDLRHPFGAPPPAPGSIRESLRAMVPLRRLATPEDIGRAVVFLCSPAAACITGASLPIDGGLLASAAEVGS